LELVERPLQTVVCFDLPRPPPSDTNDLQEIPPPKAGDSPAISIPNQRDSIVLLESLPGSVPVIYLDFQGGYTTTWGGMALFSSEPGGVGLDGRWVEAGEQGANLISAHRPIMTSNSK
jgi:hypothetical protein